MPPWMNLFPHPLGMPPPVAAAEPFPGRPRLTPGDWAGVGAAVTGTAASLARWPGLRVHVARTEARLTAPPLARWRSIVKAAAENVTTPGRFGVTGGTGPAKARCTRPVRGMWTGLCSRPGPVRGRRNRLVRHRGAQHVVAGDRGRAEPGHGRAREGHGDVQPGRLDGLSDSSGGRERARDGDGDQVRATREPAPVGQADVHRLGRARAGVRQYTRGADQCARRDRERARQCGQPEPAQPPRHAAHSALVSLGSPPALGHNTGPRTVTRIPAHSPAAPHVWPMPNRRPGDPGRRFAYRSDAVTPTVINPRWR